MIVYILCFVLFLVGLYGVITRRNLIKIAISLSIMEFSIFLILVLIGYIDNGVAPIVDPEYNRSGLCGSPAPGHGTYSHCDRPGHHGYADGHCHPFIQEVQHISIYEKLKT